MKNNNKKLAIAGVSALGLAAVGFGAFAFFSDSSEQNTDGTVGTVDVSSKGNLTLSNSGNKIGRASCRERVCDLV